MALDNKVTVFGFDLGNVEGRIIVRSVVVLSVALVVCFTIWLTFSLFGRHLEPDVTGMKARIVELEAQVKERARKSGILEIQNQKLQAEARKVPELMGQLADKRELERENERLRGEIKNASDSAAEAAHNRVLLAETTTLLRRKEAEVAQLRRDAYIEAGRLKQKIAELEKRLSDAAR